jgi:hypothetical protein
VFIYLDVGTSTPPSAKENGKHGNRGTGEHSKGHLGPLLQCRGVCRNVHAQHWLEVLCRELGALGPVVGREVGGGRWEAGGRRWEAGGRGYGRVWGMVYELDFNIRRVG